MAASLDDVFPPSPTNVPSGLTEPSKAYRRHAYLAVAGLLAFVAVYLGLIGYLGWSVYRLLGSAILHHGNVGGAALLSIPPLFFLAFLVRGLFVVKHGADEGLVEIHPNEQPTLFAFIHRLADEARAPRPHRVFVSAQVNAAVFYDLSFFNLVFPSKKNLLLGLGLVNALSIDELKAVIAHEFGHFAQRSMAVGRWVYMAQQIAGHIVVSRGIFDRFMMGLSRQDIRIAWIGWILRLVVWALRALLDTAFRLVVLADRALGREMEFNADRVAVSVSGSDSLVHALHRLGPAEDAWSEAFSFAIDEEWDGRRVDDLCALQSQALVSISHILDDPSFGKTPQRPQDAFGHRVFDAKLAQPPRMWMTHPPNRDREDHAKAMYVRSAVDERAAWLLFDDSDRLRRALTDKALEKVRAERANRSQETLSAPEAAEGSSVERLARKLSRPALAPQYRGSYLGRSIAAFHETSTSMSGPQVPADRNSVLSALDALYPSSLREQLTSYRQRREEEGLLEGLADGVLAAPGGTIRYRGEELRRGELPRALESVRSERRELEHRVLEHDRTCRAAHLAAAQVVGHGWKEHLEGLIALLHFSSHCLRSLADAHGHLHHVLDIVFADGSVSSSERRRVLASAVDVQTTLERVWAAKHELTLPSDISELFEKRGSFGALNETLGLGAPTNENLGEWLQAVEGWANGAMHDLRTLYEVTLDRLLEVEGLIADWVRTGEGPPLAPTKGTIPPRYPVCVVGKERERQKKLGWWDRFQTADGVVPGTLRAVVAVGVLGPALFVGGHVGGATLHVVNGLAVPVQVTVQGIPHTVGARSNAQWDVEPSGNVQVTTTLSDGTTIESFEAPVGSGFTHSVYNVAQAAPLLEWSAHYGADSQMSPPQARGAPRWSDAEQDFIFAEPPRSISLKPGKTAQRRVLVSPTKAPVAGQLSWVPDNAERRALIAAHVKFDPLDDGFGSWVLAASREGLNEVLQERAGREPNALALQHLLLSVATGDERTSRCAKHRSTAQTEIDDAAATSLSLACDDLERVASNAKVLEAYRRFPEHPWIAWAAGRSLAAEQRFAEAAKAVHLALEAKETASIRREVQLFLVRLQRAANVSERGVAPIKVRAIEGSTLQFIEQVEREPKDEESTAVRSFRALRQGHLEEALHHAGSTGPVRDRLTLLVGASEGSSKSQVENALQLEGMDDDWVMLGLRFREGQAVTSVHEAIHVGEAQGRAIAEVLGSPRLKKSPHTLTEAVKGLALNDRAQVIGMGVLVLGSDAPAVWRQEAKEVLFVVERPYFR